MSTLAERQLAAWQAIAETWLVSHDAQYSGPSCPGDPSWRCGDCGTGIALAFDSQGKRYVYTDEQWLALVVLHLRNHHAELDPDKH